MWLFLMVIALIWLIAGSIQDCKTKEISDWITLSLLVIGLGTRGLFAFHEKDFSILSLGLLSSVILLSIAFIFYYSKVFAGGDFKLLVGLGPFIPGSNFGMVLMNISFFLAILLIMGFIGSIIASIVIACKNKKQFSSVFIKKKNSYWLILPFIILLAVTCVVLKDNVVSILLGIISLALVAYPFLLSVDSCMIKSYSPRKLTPGDWLFRDIRVGNRVIKASAHGVSEEEIAFLIKHNKKVLIKEGIPFVPAFLIAFIIMVLFFVLQGENFAAEILAQLF